jgi:hypothetical protein
MNLESAPEHPTSSAFMLMNSSALNASSFRDPLLTDNFSLETNEEESVEELSTVQLLIQHLRNELGSPELLSYPTDFMEELFELITTQVISLTSFSNVLNPLK